MRAFWLVVVSTLLTWSTPGAQSGGERSESVRVLELAGTPYERGLRHGEELKPRSIKSSSVGRRTSSVPTGDRPVTSSRGSSR